MGESTLRQVDDRRHRQIADLLRLEWRMFERVSLKPCPDGHGFTATIFLDQMVVNGAAEQQGLRHSPAAMSAAESRRLNAIAECVARANARLTPADAIRDFRVVG
jgi:hypothetical protein